MSHAAHDNSTIRQLIDACPAGVDALDLPEFAALAQAIKREPAVGKQLAAARKFDQQLAAALAQVEIPPQAQFQLVERLNAELELPRFATVSLPDAAASAATTAQPVRAARQAKAARWAVVACLLAAAAVAAWSWSFEPRIGVISLAEHWQANLAEQWQPLPPGPKGYPVPADLAFTPRSWQRMPDHGGYRGVAYDFSRPGARATLFVVRVMPDQQLPNRPPQSPQYSAGGRMMAAWIADKWLCLLVMDGNQRTYESLLRGRTAPLALGKMPYGLLASATAVRISR